MIIAYKDAVECDEQTSPRFGHMQIIWPKYQTINTQAHGRYVSASIFNI
jgi:hypothetical protein